MFLLLLSLQVFLPCVELTINKIFLSLSPDMVYYFETVNGLLFIVSSDTHSVDIL